LKVTEAEVEEFGFVFLRAVSQGQSEEQVRPLTYSCKRPSATSVWGLKLLGQSPEQVRPLSYTCRRPSATSVWGLKLQGQSPEQVSPLKLLVYEALSY
jgi:hypothetical protein